MRPAIAQVCSLMGPFESDVADYAAGHCLAMEVYWTKIETYIEQHGIPRLKELLLEHGMATPVASFQGGILASQGDARKVAWELFSQRLQYSEALEIETFVVHCDVPGPLTETTIDRVRLSLEEAAKQAASHGVRIAIEPQANSAFANNIQTAAVLVAEVGSAHLGICLDAFHFYTGPSKYFDLDYLTCDNLFHVQVSDLADTPREFARDSDRILPGDGDIPLEPIISHLQAINYTGYVSLELLNPHLWQVPALQIGEIGMTAMRRLLGQAAME
jgi:2-keto-myo-inositol isomerase